MASLKIKLNNGDVITAKITPAVEYAFEQHSGKGFYKAITEDQKQTDVYWIAWRCLVAQKVDVAAFGTAFLDTLESVEIVDDSPKE